MRQDDLRLNGIQDSIARGFMRYRLMILFTLAAALGCESTGEPYEAGDGITAPKLQRVVPTADAPVISLEPLWSIQPDVWAEPSRISVSDGRIAIVDPPLNQVHLITLADGSFLTSVGRQGSGPGEWVGLRSAALVGDQLVASLSSSTSLRVHTLSGELVREIEMGRPALQLMQTGSGLIASNLGTAAPMFRQVDLKDGTVRSEVSAERTNYPPESYGECWQYTVSSRGVLRLRCSAGRFEEVDPEGGIARWLEWPDQPVASTEAELDRYMDRFWALRSGGRPMTPLVQRQMENVRESAAIKEQYSLLRSDPSTGRILVLEQPFGAYAAEAGVVHLLSADGKHIGRLVAPTVVHDAAIVGDTLLLLLRDLSTDELGLRAWRMALND